VVGPVSLVAILFTDLVGSTELLARLGEEAAEDLRHTHFTLLRDAVAAGGGQEVKTLGDGIMVVFPNPSAALAGAVAMQQSIARHNRQRPGRALAVRVGVSAGEVTCEEDDYFGTPVVEAARLCAAAQGGQILVAELAGRLAANRIGASLEPVGTLTLKGLPEPVAALAVQWQAELASAIPVPAALESQRRRHFVGRTEERRALADAVKAAAAGDRQMVLVAGEPGMGKTRLVTEASLEAHAAGATVLYGRCGEELGIPYRPITEALRHYVTACSPGQLSVHVETHGGELIRLVPDLARLVPGVPAPRNAEPDTERFVLFEAVAGLLSLAAQDGPVMLVLDDLHWADRATIALADHLMRWAEPMPLVLVGTYRDSDLTRTHPLSAALADWRRDQTVRRLALRGLSDADAVDLVGLAAGHELDDAGVAFAQAARRETDGSPFFLHETLRHLSEIGALRQEEDGRWRYHGDLARLDIPESVREVIGRRVHRLSEGAARALEYASVIGRDFDLAVLARMLEEPADRVLAGLEEALEARLVAEVAGAPGRFSFAHALVRQTLYEEFSAARRLTLHRRVAQTLEDVYGPDAGSHLPELAHHWLTAVPPAAFDHADRAKAVDYARQAARRAMDALAFEQAGGHCEAALQVLTGDDVRLRCGVLVELGEARWRSGDVSGGQEAFVEAAALARRSNEAELLARAALGYGGGLGGAGHADRADPALLTLLDEALEALGEDNPALRSRLLGRLAVELYFTDEVERRDAAGREAVVLAQQLGDPSSQLVALYSRHWSMLGPDGMEERQAAAAEVVRIADAAGDREMAFRGHYMRLRTALELGDIATGDDAMQACERLAHELRQPLYTWQVLVFRATNAIAEARLAEGEQLAREALALGQRPAPQAATTAFGGHITVHLYLTGRSEEILLRIKERAESLPDEPIWGSAYAWHCAEAGRLDDAAAAFEAMVGAGLGRLRRNGNWTATLYALGAACGLLDDENRASELYAVLLPYAGRLVVTATGAARLAATDGALGVLAATLGRLEDAARHFEAALRLHAECRLHAWTVVTARDYARLLVERQAPGDAERAREIVDEALAIARAAEMARFAEQLEALRP
jgi:class 3 adenylate cyclase/tetratricopeptide (TPR) repeat protein